MPDNLIEYKKMMLGEPMNGNEPMPSKSIPARATPEMIQGWEAYREHLEKTGHYGSPKLNTQFGKELFMKWASKNPKYNLNWDTLPLIGQELATQKSEIAQKLAAGKVSLNIPISQLNPTDVSNLRTKNPWWPGTEFTQQGFTKHEDVVRGPKGEILKKTTFGIDSAGERRKKIS